jgi:hypothetical protein
MAYLFYTVQPADVAHGLVGIAQRIYGSADWWTVLYDANRAVIGENPSLIEAGQQLVVPQIGEREVAQGVAVYHVQPWDLDDGLDGIALRLWGDVSRGAWLYAINRGIIGNNPQQLRVGQRLLIVPA